jgi:hypothetical protein
MSGESHDSQLMAENENQKATVRKPSSLNESRQMPLLSPRGFYLRQKRVRIIQNQRIRKKIMPNVFRLKQTSENAMIQAIDLCD